MKLKNFRNVFFAFLMIVCAAGAIPAFAAVETAPATEQVVPPATELNADEALALLKEGNARFAAMRMEHPAATLARREETAAKGQKPFAVVLGCSDSRVPVEMIFDRGIGDIFTVRVAGNIAVDHSVIGSLEYATGHLHVPLLVILGHTQCGAAEAAISDEKLEGSIADIQGQLKSVVKEVKLVDPDLKGAALTDKVAEQNAFQVERDLRINSEMIRNLSDQGALKTVVAIYDVSTGEVKWLE